MPGSRLPLHVSQPVAVLEVVRALVHDGASVRMVIPKWTTGAASLKVRSGELLPSRQCPWNQRAAGQGHCGYAGAGLRSGVGGSGDGRPGFRESSSASHRWDSGRLRDMDWLSPVTGLVGVVIGGGIGLRGSKAVADRQLADAQQAREDAERIAVVAVLAKALGMLLEKADQIPKDQFRFSEGHEEDFEQQLAADHAWELQWQPLLRPARMAALEVRDQALRGLLLEGLNYVQSLDMMEYAFFRKSRTWVLTEAVTHMIECAYAWRLREDLPPASPAFSRVQDSYQQKTEEWEYTMQAQDEERERRRRATSDEGSVSGAG